MPGTEDVVIRAVIEAEDHSAAVINDALQKARTGATQTQAAMTQVHGAISAAAQRQGITYQEMAQRIERASKQAGAAVTSTVPPIHAQTGAFNKASEAVNSYLGRFVGFAVVADTMRRMVTSSAEFGRAMNRIGMESGMAGDRIEELKHKFDDLAAGTGRSATEMANEFRSFRDAVGDMGGNVEKAFKQVADAAIAADTPIKNMAAAAVVALKELNLPFKELEGVLDVWVKQIPSSMMTTWAAASSGIITQLRTIGLNGEDAAKKAGTAFGSLAGALGSAHRASSLLAETLRQATDAETLAGRVLLPQTQKLLKEKDGELKIAKALFEHYKSLGVYSDDLETKQYARAHFAKGVRAEFLLDLEKQQIMEKEIAAEAKRNGESEDSVRARRKQQMDDQLGGLQAVKAAFEAVGVAIGDAFGTELLKTFARDLKELALEIKLVTNLFKPTKDYSRDKGPQTPPVSGMDMEFNPFKGTPKRTGLRPGGLPYLAEGGAFQVPPSGQTGTDTQPIGFMATPGERVAVTTPLQESLRVQQDKADQADREHFARFRGGAFTQMAAAPWWPGGAGGGRGGGGGGGGGGAGAPSTPGTGGGPPSTGDGKTPTTTETPTTTQTPTGPAAAPPSHPSVPAPVGLPAWPGWGVDIPEAAVQAGGGIGKGIAGDVPGLPGGPSGRSLTPEERAAGGAAPPAAPPTAGAPPSGGGGYLAQARASRMAEIKNNPALRTLLGQMIASEGEPGTPGGQATLEALVNRSMMVGNTLMEELNSGFYRPINEKRAQQRVLTPAQQAAVDKHVVDVGGGSNIIQGRNNQGMLGDPGSRDPGVIPIPGTKEIFNYWTGKRGGKDFSLADSQRFAENLNKQAAANPGGAASTSAPPGTSTPSGVDNSLILGKEGAERNQYGLALGGQMTPTGLLVHHTDTHNPSPAQLAGVLKDRKSKNAPNGLSVQFFIDREGKIHQLTPEGRQTWHAGELEHSERLTGTSRGNFNMEGVEVAAKNEGDLLPVQREAIAKLTAMRSKRWGWDPKTGTWGHGELTGRKQATEGATAKMIREGRFDQVMAATLNNTAAPSTAPGQVVAPATGVVPGTYPNVEEAQDIPGRIRALPIDPRLKGALDVAAAENGLKVRVTSGGQDPHGVEGKTRTGSLRHNKGLAADFDLLDAQGKVLQRNDPRRLAFLERAAALGAGGTGAGYMSDPLKIHAGITGKEGIPGKGLGPYAGNAAEQAAVNRGVASYTKDSQQLARALAERAAKTQVAGPAAPTTGLPPAVTAGRNPYAAAIQGLPGSPSGPALTREQRMAGGGTGGTETAPAAEKPSGVSTRDPNLAAEAAANPAIAAALKLPRLPGEDDKAWKARGMAALAAARAAAPKTLPSLFGRGPLEVPPKKAEEKPSAAKPKAPAPAAKPTPPAAGKVSGKEFHEPNKDLIAAGEKAIAEGRQLGGQTKAGKPYVVGEAGPELIVPGQSGTVFPGQQLEEWQSSRKLQRHLKGVERGMEEQLGQSTVDEQTLEGWQNRARQGGPADGPGGTNINFSGAMSQYRAMAEQMSQPIRPQLEVPNMGPIRHRMSRRVEGQRDRDMERLNRHAAHADIGFG